MKNHHLIHSITAALCLLSAQAVAGSAAMPSTEGEEQHEAMKASSMHAMPEMQMQGGDAPADSRDPHAYSGGHSLSEGPYALPESQRLRLADEEAFWAVMGDRLEYDNDDNVAFDLSAWYGGTYDRVWLKLEGDYNQDGLEETQAELLWGHAISSYFDFQLGTRFDYYADGQNRQWLALGVQGLAPYWFELDLTAYLGEQGRSALSLEAEYEWLLTQRLILQPRAELTLYGKDDPQNGIGSGLSDASLGLRLRYEFSRQFAPYVGIERKETFGATADYLEAAGESAGDTRVLAGIRFWF